MKRRKSYSKRVKTENYEKLERGTIHEIIQPIKVYVWICPRKGCVHGNFAERFQATVEGFLMVQVNSHIGMHEREDATEKRMSDIDVKTKAFH